MFNKNFNEMTEDEIEIYRKKYMAYLSIMQKTFNVKEQKLLDIMLSNLDENNPQQGIKLDKKEMIKFLWPGITDEKIGKQHYTRLNQSMNSMLKKLSKMAEEYESEYVTVEFEENFFNKLVKELREKEENQIKENQTKEIE